MTTSERGYLDVDWRTARDKLSDAGKSKTLFGIAMQ